MYKNENLHQGVQKSLVNMQMCVLFAVAIVVAWCTLSLLNSVKETLFTKTTLTTLFAQIYLKTYFTFNNWKQQKLTDTSLQTSWE